MVMQIFEMLLDGMMHGVDFLRTVELTSGVSLWSFILTTFIVSIVISGVVNVVKIGSVRGGRRSSRSSKSDDGGDS